MPCYCSPPNVFVPWLSRLSTIRLSSYLHRHVFTMIFCSLTPPTMPETAQRLSDFNQSCIHFLKILVDISDYCGAAGASALGFWWCLLWVSKPAWTALFALGRGLHVRHYLEVTSDLMAAEQLAEIRDLTRDWTQIARLVVSHSNYYTRMFSVLVWGCYWILFSIGNSIQFVLFL